jgi:hypothetical protein
MAIGGLLRLLRDGVAASVCWTIYVALLYLTEVALKCLHVTRIKGLRGLFCRFSSVWEADVRIIIHNSLKSVHLGVVVLR